MSEIFDGYEEQYCKLSTNLNKKCNSVSSNEVEKKQKFDELKAGLDQAESLIRRMDLEAQTLPPTQKVTLTSGSCDGRLSCQVITVKDLMSKAYRNRALVYDIDVNHKLSPVAAQQREEIVFYMTMVESPTRSRVGDYCNASRQHEVMKDFV